MLNPKDLRVGSIVKLTGTIVESFRGGDFYVNFGVKDDKWRLTSYELSQAELVSHPKPKISKEAAEAIKIKLGLFHPSMSGEIGKALSHDVGSVIDSFVEEE